MAFNLQNMNRTSSGANANAPTVFAYASTAETTAAIVAASYFNSFANSLQVGDLIYVRASDGNGWVVVTAVAPNVTVDALAAIGPGGVDTAQLADGAVTNAKVDAAAAIAFSKLAALTSAEIIVGSAGNVATAVAMTGDVAIDNAGATTIQAGAIDLAMLSAGITSSHVVKFGAQYTTTGGAADEGIAIAGVLATDLAFVQLVDPGTNTVTVSIAVCTVDTLTITFSGDPGNDAVINYQILRAAA